MPSAIGPKSRSNTANYGRLIGLSLQLIAVLWFVFVWFTFKTDLVEWRFPKAELLMPIYLLYMLGIIIVVMAQLMGMRRYPPQNRSKHVFQILMWPAFSLIVLYLLIDWIKFGFT